MKSAILCLLIVFSIAFSLYGNEYLDWNSGSSGEPITGHEKIAKPDSVKSNHLNSFSSRTEYTRLNINDKYSESIFFTSNSLSIPVGRFEAILNIDKYDYDVYEEYYDGYYDRYIVRNTAMELMGKYRLIKDWKIGLGTIIKENATEKITFNNYMKLELSKQVMQEDAKLGFKAYLEESLEKEHDFQNGYVESGYYTPEKSLHQSSNHWGGEFYYCLANHSYLVKEETLYPLTFAVPHSAYFAGGFDYTYISRYSWSDNAHNYHYAREGWLQANYKIIKQLEASFYGVLTEYNVDRKRSPIDYYTTWIDVKAGLTGYLYESNGATLMANVSYLHQYYHRDLGAMETSNPVSVVPSAILMYRFNEHLQLSSLMTRKYYVGDSHDDIYNIEQSTWDFKLSVMVDY